MKVKDLIVELQKRSPEAEVYIAYWEMTDSGTSIEHERKISHIQDWGNQVNLEY